MTKTLKKTLAIVVALALCLSAFMGCFSVSAVDANGVSIATEIDGDTAIVDFTLEAVADDAFTVALFDIEFDEALNIVGIHVDGINPATELPYPDEPAIEISTDSGVELAEISHNSITNGVADVSVANAAKAIRVIVETKAVANIADATVTITFDIADLEAKDYAVSATVQAATAGTYDGVNWGNDEELIKFGDATTTTATGAITVKPAHVHEYSKVNYDEAGHWTECECGVKTDKVPHEWKDGDRVESTCTVAGSLAQSCDCGATQTIALDLAAHTPVVDEAVAPTCTETGLTEGSHCDVCGAVIVAQKVVEATGHSGDWVYSFENRNYVRTCTCGVTETKELEYSSETSTAGFSGKTLDFEEAISVVYFVEGSDVADADGFFLQVTQNLYNKEPRIEYLNGTYGDYGGAEMEYEFVYRGVAAKEFNDELTAVLYTVKNGVAYPSEALNYNPKTYAMNQINKNPGKPNLKKAMVDLLNYGAAAQTAFSYNTGSLANADLSEEQLALGTPITEIPTLVDERDYGADNDTMPVKNTAPSVDFESSVGIVYYCDIAKYTDGGINDLTLVISRQDNGAVLEVVPLSAFNKTSSDENDKEYDYSFFGLSAKEMRVECHFRVYANYGTELQNQVNSTMTYSIETYAARQSGKKFQDVTRAMMRYGDSVEFYLANK